MMLALRNPANFAPTGTWAATLVGTESSIGTPYAYGGGTFRDVTNSSSTKTWAYTPGQIDDTYSISYPQEVSGVYKVALVSNGRAAVETRLDLTVSGGGTYARCTGFQAGSYGEFSWDLIKAKLDVSGKTKPLLNGAGTAFSADCWAAAFDWSGMSIWNSRSNNGRRRGCLITPRHLWLTKHYPYPVGTVVRFIGTDGVAVERTVIAVAYDGDLSDRTQDEYVALLNADVPNTVNPFPVAGDWLATYTPSGDLYILQMFAAFVTVDQNDDALLCPSVSNPNRDVVVGSNTTLAGVRWHDACDPSQFDTYATVFDGYESWAKLPVGGDSGSGVFAPLSSSTLALASVITGPWGGDSYQHLDSLIDAADTAAGISTGYTVTVAPDPTN